MNASNVRCLVPLAAAWICAGCATVDLNSPETAGIRSGPVETSPSSASQAAIPESSATQSGVVLHEVTVANPTVRPIAPLPQHASGAVTNAGTPPLSSGSSGTDGAEGENSPARQLEGKPGDVTSEGVLLMKPKAVPGQ